VGAGARKVCGACAAAAAGFSVRSKCAERERIRAAAKRASRVGTPSMVRWERASTRVSSAEFLATLRASAKASGERSGERSYSPERSSGSS